jgi:hypothetical protein
MIRSSSLLKKILMIALPVVVIIGPLFLAWWITLMLLLIYFCATQKPWHIFVLGGICGALYDVLFWGGQGKFGFFTHIIVFLAAGFVVYFVRKYTRVLEFGS